jgi:hypothetical protein
LSKSEFGRVKIDILAFNHSSALSGIYRNKVFSVVFQYDFQMKISTQLTMTRVRLRNLEYNLQRFGLINVPVHVYTWES